MIRRSPLTYVPHQLMEELLNATDMELAMAYEQCMEDPANEIFPLYMVVNEMQDRGYTFHELEGLLAHQYEEHPYEYSAKNL